MSENQRRTPRGVPTGGQFATTARTETGVTLAGDGGGPASGVTEALSELLEAYMGGDPAVANVAERLAAITPHAPVPVTAGLWDDAVAAHLDADWDTCRDALGRIAQWDARDARWTGDPSFEPPTAAETFSGGNGPVVYTTVTGGRYTGYRPVAEVAKDVRGDLKDAQRRGYLPEGLRFAVTSASYVGGQRLLVTVQGMSDEDIYARDRVTWSPVRRLSAEAVEIRTRVEAIGGAYARSTTHSQTDYFEATYWCQVEVEDERTAAWRASERERARERRAAR